MRRPGSGEDGFTIVEVMVAAVILLVGILGVTTIVNTSNATTTSNKAREQGLALAREMIESARSVRYQNLRPSSAVSTVQAMPGLGDAGGDGWTIQRRGITFTVSLGVCSVDDPGDGTGAHVANAFCSRSAVQASADTCKTLIGTPAKISGTGGSAGLDGGDCGLDTNLDGAVDGLVQSTASDCPNGTSVSAGTCDAQPDDFKRLVVLVTWDRGSGNRYVLQQATESFPGLSAYAGITSLELHNAGPAPAGGYVVAPDGSGSNVSALQFDAASSEPANQVDWLLNGADQGPASWSGTSGSFTWSLGNNAPASETEPATGEVVDGSYTIGARVQDASGIHGSELDTTVTLNRRKPFKPKGLTALVQSDGSVLLAWIAPADQDVTGYQVMRSVGGGLAGSLSGCESVTTTTCTDTNPPSSGTVTYYVHALDRDTSGATRAGWDSDPVTVSTGSSATAPATPGPLSITVVKTTGKKVTIQVSWPAVTGSPTVTQYGIWRDTQTGSPATVNATSSPYYQDTFFATESHTYYVVSISNGVTSKTSATITYTP